MEARLDAEFGRDTDDSGWNLLFLVIYMYLIVCLTIAWFLVSLSWMLHIFSKCLVVSQVTVPKAWTRWTTSTVLPVIRPSSLQKRKACSLFVCEV